MYGGGGYMMCMQVVKMKGYTTTLHHQVGICDDELMHIPLVHSVFLSAP